MNSMDLDLMKSSFKESGGQGNSIGLLVLSIGSEISDCDFNCFTNFHRVVTDCTVFLKKIKMF